jgi:hypothetical protein
MKNIDYFSLFHIDNYNWKLDNFIKFKVFGAFFTLALKVINHNEIKTLSKKDFPILNVFDRLNAFERYGLFSNYTGAVFKIELYVVFCDTSEEVNLNFKNRRAI